MAELRDEDIVTVGPSSTVVLPRRPRGSAQLSFRELSKVIGRSTLGDADLVTGRSAARLLAIRVDRAPGSFSVRL
jgi:hypothetical protein